METRGILTLARLVYYALVDLTAKSDNKSLLELADSLDDQLPEFSDDVSNLSNMISKFRELAQVASVQVGSVLHPAPERDDGV